MEVKLAPHSSYAFHEAQSIKGDVKPPLLMFNNASSREIDDIQFNRKEVESSTFHKLSVSQRSLARAQVEILCDSTETCA